MRSRFPGSVMIAIAAAAGSAAILAPTAASAQTPEGSAAPSSAALKTPWGEPDFQGIWTDETTTPLQRPAKYADKVSFSEAERAELDQARTEVLGRERRAERGTERDVSGSYNNVFVSFKKTGPRTSLIVDPPNGRLPPRPRRSSLPTGRFVSPCCSRPRPARIRSQPVMAEPTTRPARRDSPSSRFATTRRG
jgi:hypothetical protein